MSNFSPKLEDATEKELRYMVNELDFRVVHLASDELTRRTLNDLQKTIEDSNKHSEKLESANYKLQIIMLALTAIGTFVAISPIVKIIINWLALAGSEILKTPLASSEVLNIISAVLSVLSSYIAIKSYDGFIKKRAKKIIKREQALK